MLTNPEDFKTVIAGFAAGVSALGAIVATVSVLVSRKNWVDSNRPIVTAYIDEESGGAGLTVFNLHLTNSGTRPATSVLIIAKGEDVHKLLEDEVDSKKRELIEVVFSSESMVPVLHQGEKLVTSFGLSTTDASEKWLRYGTEILVRIEYFDLEGRKYRSAVPLKLRPRQGFGGGVWRTAA